MHWQNKDYVFLINYRSTKAFKWTYSYFLINYPLSQLLAVYALRQKEFLLFFYFLLSTEIHTVRGVIVHSQ